MMRGVAIRASYVVRTMCRPQEIAVLFAVLVASQAASRDLLCRCSLENKNFGTVAPTGDVRFARTMAGFAPLEFFAAPRIESSLPVRRFLKRRVNIVVAGLAGLGSNVPCRGSLRSIRSRGRFRR